MKPLNPYEPPQPRRLAPFLVRLQNAIRRARTEWRQGLERDKFTRTQLVLSWIALVAMLWAITALLTLACYAVYMQFIRELMLT